MSRRSRVARVFAAMASAVAAFACGPARPAATAGGASLVAKNVAASGSVVAACVPTGPELCFNANDDNCNGVIDEGCGVGTGVLQFMVGWGDSPADVDISVIDPNGAKVHKGNRSGASGLELERNCPEDGCHGQNVENVYFGGNDPPRGKYAVEVKLADARGAELPVKAHLSVRVGARTYAMDVALSPEKGHDKHTFTFEL